MTGLSASRRWKARNGCFDTTRSEGACRRFAALPSRSATLPRFVGQALWAAMVYRLPRGRRMRVPRPPMPSLPSARLISGMAIIWRRKRRSISMATWPGMTPRTGTRPAHESATPTDAVPTVGTAYLWDGDHMAAEAPLHLDGHVAWDDATHWHFEENSHRLLAKQLPSDEMLAVVCDHLGTPKEMFDDKGDLVWAADHHVWGAIRTTRTFGALAVASRQEREPDELFCPWRFPGQYEDAETGLYYNRHRHYDALSGQYASSDPIGLDGGDRPQGYVDNPAAFCDLFGLSAVAAAKGSETYYRVMSPADFAELQKTNKLPATRETFIATDPGYYSHKQYDGILVKFEARAGTRSKLYALSGRHGRDVSARAYPDLPLAQKWTETGGMFKVERGFENIGLGRGPALETFNSNIIRYEPVK
ncbi:RHS repeat domain-containing protein [Oryzifoliimicrobium ureilyticus]|uniref:RHS repeat domain-containing protein n=1 Tax=Oryzifoliimicrobium ureilyticus TaxID=3113724 RepID=UPI003F67B3C9